jgi:hypothetical protein
MQALPTSLNLGRNSWSLRLESFGPDDSANNLDEKGEMIDPTRHKRTVLEFTDIGLQPWNELSVAESDLSSLGSKFNAVTSMSDVSGIGHYSRSFTLPAEWESTRGILRIAHGEDMITAVTVNGVTLDRINQFVDEVDLLDTLRPGEDNVIEIKLDTTLRNRISLETGSFKPRYVTGELQTANGLTSVVLEPYRQDDVLQAEMTGT